MRQPGERFRALAQRFCSPRTLARIVDPTIADMRHEHAEAIARGRHWRALWARAAGHWAAARALAMHAWDSPIGRGVYATVAAIAGLTFLLAAVPMWTTARRGLLDGRSAATILSLVACLVPQAVAISIPLGLVAGIMCGWRDAADRARNRRVILAITLAWTAVGFVNLGWLTPVANQRYRVVAFGRPLAPGANELSLGELGRRVEIEKTDPALAATMLAPESLPLALYYHMRLAVAGSPLILSAFAVIAARIRRQFIRRMTTIVGLALFLSGYVMFGHEQIAVALRWLSPAVIPWIPNTIVIAFTVLTMALLSFRAEPAACERRP